MLVALVLAALLLLLYAAPEVGGVRLLHRLLVVGPARFLSRLSPAKILFVLALCLAAWILIGLFAGEGVKLFTMMAPDTILWFAMFDVATMVDALLFGLIVSSSVRLSAVMKRVQTVFAPVRDLIVSLARPAARDRTRKTRPTALRKPPRADDPDGWPGMFAYAG